VVLLVLLAGVGAVAAGLGRRSGRARLASQRLVPAPRPHTTAAPAATHPDGTPGCRLGHPATLSGSDGVALRVVVGAPTSSTAAYSSYAAAPQYGYYLMFPVSVVSTGVASVLLDPPQQFSIDAGAGVENTYSGNAKYSGSSSVLEPVPLDPGQGATGPIIFDVPRLHGTLALRVSGVPGCRWTF
jgi:hypothetical protein